MAIEVLQEATDEALAAIRYYAQIRPDLAYGLAAAIAAALAKLSGEIAPVTAVLGRAGELGAKRLLLKGFPFEIVLLHHEDTWIVVAVAHLHRRPGYWRDRLFVVGK